MLQRREVYIQWSHEGAQAPALLHSVCCRAGSWKLAYCCTQVRQVLWVCTAVLEAPDLHRLVKVQFSLLVVWSSCLFSPYRIAWKWADWYWWHWHAMQSFHGCALKPTWSAVTHCLDKFHCYYCYNNFFDSIKIIHAACHCVIMMSSQNGEFVLATIGGVYVRHYWFIVSRS